MDNSIILLLKELEDLVKCKNVYVQLNLLTGEVVYIYAYPQELEEEFEAKEQNLRETIHKNIFEYRESGGNLKDLISGVCWVEIR